MSYEEKQKWRIREELATPFQVSEVRWKPQQVKDNRCLAIPYIDARLIMDRLDEVVGVDDWADDYEILNDGSVICRLSVRVNGEWVTKIDVGNPSQQPDSGDRLKAAFSDALKRAAVKFGIGRYLYRIRPQWVDYDPRRKQIIKPPPLPDFARPENRKKPDAAYVEPEEAEEHSEPATLPNGSLDVKEVKRQWMELVTAVANPDELTALLPRLADIANPDLKDEIKDYIAKSAAGIGWSYNAGLKKFVAK